MPYENELKVAVQAVRDAAIVCRKVQAALVTAETLEKKDKSPVTVADFASQAVVCKALADAFGDDRVVGEEGAGDLRGEANTPLRDQVVSHTAEIVHDASEEDVLHWIDRGGYDPAKEGAARRYWTLDPIDGTKGFLRGQQYAIALALIEDGKVVLGALGCPNLQHTDGPDGCLFTAVRGEGAKMLAIDGEGVEGTAVTVDEVMQASDAKFCESVESGHSNQGDSATIATILGITADPYRIDSQCKYAAVSRGDASIYLRLPTRADYQEKIWDHGAGSIVVEEAGGTVTDVAGNALDFSLGRTLANNRGIIATNGRFHDEVVSAVQSVIG
ncbi:MAG: 3'(2'),5'-bisphosphate nucleotidase [Phycisphaeraceae bacterium]|nr:3'(2'),5'-bisphosphate nucleotidase [Phycisphaeraceae bacterium]